MQKITIIALIALVSVYGVHVREELAPMVEQLNSMNLNWVAGYNERHNDFTLEHVKAQCGSLPENVHEKFPQMNYDHIPDSAVPDDFDARTQWSNCESIQELRDQANCGSCWAFGAAEAMSDRLCIASGQTDQTRISTADLNSCCSSCGNGCNGGYPGAAWDYYQNTGLCSGGLYEDTTWCWAYQLAPCAHHVHSDVYPDCPASTSTPACTETCSGASGKTFNSDIHRGSSSYSLSGVANIKKDIMTYGPVECAMSVYADFESYKSGVYSHQSGSYLGGHAMKVLGWGTEGGQDYWLVANSWNESWGDKGFIKILQGDCGINDGIVAGHAPASSFLY